MKREGHDAVGGVKRFLDAVAVMNVDVNVEHALVKLEQLHNAQHNVVDIAEARRFALLRVMQSACPVHCHICLIVIEAHCSINRTSCCNLRKFINSIKYRTIITDIKHMQLFDEMSHVVGRDVTQKIHIVVRVEYCQFFVVASMRFKNIHFIIQSIVDQQIMGHSNSMRFHWMRLAIIEIANFSIIKISHTIVCGCCGGGI
mmetsp:Transcript_22290/g.37806  ORF Transcript_22290/g.37806 Transcript_22290/m.37806 type:complete len:201 (-) Transcript_22290:18-620(-)